VVTPLHPRTRKVLAQLSLPLPATVRLVEPVGFLDMVRLEMAARVIATDSGGVQKEAFFHGVPCVTMRDETEWIELTEIGANRLWPPIDPQALAELLWRMEAPLPQRPNLFGNGSAAREIACRLANSRPCGL
jgi:UDP-GlcNAc3NAcA epimerase